MNNNVADLLTKLVSNNIVYDENSSITYSQLVNSTKELDKIFDHKGKDSIQCVHIPIQNDINTTRLILYLLTKGINFYMGSGSVRYQGTPHFCDMILSSEATRHRNLVADYQLTENLNYVKTNGLIPSCGYVIFSTSGSTGAPKYVVYKSCNLVANALKISERLGLKKNKKILVPVPIGHMYGFGVGVLPAILKGASLSLIAKNNVIKLYDYLQRFKPNITLLTPTVCKMLITLSKNIDANTLYITAGDKISEEAYNQFESKFGELINLYGCTELGAIATSDNRKSKRLKGILTPLDGISIKLDQYSKGEICCKHDCSFEGYIDQNGERILAKAKDGEWFRTKDLGINLGTNQFKILGRIDHCINRLGFLVSFQEIETAIQNLFIDIDQIIVLFHSDDSMKNGRLIAFCSPGDFQVQRKIEIKSICREKLPSHLVPDDFCFMKKLPCLSNGKPDRLLLKNQINYCYGKRRYKSS